MTDVQALKQYADHRDAQAFHLLVAQYQQLVYSAARRRLANQHDIDDVVQLTFLKLASASDKIRDDLGSWLYTTTLNNANELIRKDQTRRRHEALAPPPPPSDGALADTLHQEEWQTLSPKIDDAILALPPDQRTLIIQHFFQNRSQRDLADALHTTQPTIHRHLNSAIASIRASLRAAGHLCAAPAVVSVLHNGAQLPVPAPLSAELTKIGLAGTGAKPVVTAKAAFSLGAKLAIAATLLIIAGISGFLFHESMPPRAPSTALPAPGPGAPSPIDPLADAWARNQPANPAFKIQDMTGGSGTAARVTSAYVDSADNAYYMGYTQDANRKMQGFLRRKSADSSTWFTYRTSGGAPIYSIVESPNGDLYEAQSAWGITMRPAGSDTFVKQPVTQHGWQDSYMADLKFDVDGALYFVGSWNGVWAVVKRAPDGSEFTQIDSFALDLTPQRVATFEERGYTDITSCAEGFATVKTGPLSGIYVVGYSLSRADSDVARKEHWIVRRSTDAGKTWSTVDDFFSPSNARYVATSVCSDRQGNLFVAGYATDNRWIVRKCAADHPDNWVTVDEMQGGRPSNIKEGPDGSLFVVGREFDAKDPRKSRANVRTNISGKWQTVFQYQSTFDTTEFDSMAYDQTGHVYLGGTVHSPGLEACMVMTTTFDALTHPAISTEPAQLGR